MPKPPAEKTDKPMEKEAKLAKAESKQETETLDEYDNYLIRQMRRIP